MTTKIAIFTPQTFSDEAKVNNVLDSFLRYVPEEEREFHTIRECPATDGLNAVCHSVARGPDAALLLSQEMDRVVVFSDKKNNGVTKQFLATLKKQAPHVRGTLAYV